LAYPLASSAALNGQLRYVIGRIQLRDIAAPGAALQAATPATGEPNKFKREPNSKRRLRDHCSELPRRSIVGRQFTRLALQSTRRSVIFKETLFRAAFLAFLIRSL
jgi:hypothetical protein